MRKIESRLIAAIHSGKDFSCSNTTLRWEGKGVEKIGTVRLHGNRIALILSNAVELFDCGWQSKTTKSRLNAIIQGLEVGRGIYQEKYQWYFAGYGYTTKWTSTQRIEYWRTETATLKFLKTA